MKTIKKRGARGSDVATSAAPMTPASIAATWPRPGRRVSVTDQRTERIASAIADEMTIGEREADARGRKLEVTIHADHGVNENSPVLVEIDMTDFASGQYARSSGFGSIRFRKHTLDVQLGDLPLLVLSLTEAIRIGVEQGAFPEIRGSGK